MLYHVNVGKSGRVIPVIASSPTLAAKSVKYHGRAGDILSVMKEVENGFETISSFLVCRDGDKDYPATILLERDVEDSVSNFDIVNIIMVRLGKK